MREGFTSFATCFRCGRHDFRDYFVLTDTTGHGERIEYACEPRCDDAVETSFFRMAAYLLIAGAVLMVLGYVVGAVTAGGSQ